jgi:hypothetical protein
MVRSTSLTIALLLLASTAAAQTFRMETDVIEGSAKTPFCRVLTLFTDGLAYDFLTLENSGDKGKTTEITVFDIPNGRVVMLSPDRSVKTVVSLEELLKTTTDLKVNIKESDKLFHFAAHPKFDVKFSPEAKELALRSDIMTYIVKCAKAESAGAARTYQEFADWSARLNALRPGNLPPFARIELSREIAQRDFVPAEITRTIVVPATLRNRKQELLTRHHVNWILSSTDHARIQRVAQQIGDFKTVPFQEFIK